MTLFVQGTGKPFGPALIREFERPDCRRVDIAVAWVRATGLRHLQTAMVDALGRGVHLRVVVGIDADNTSYEGLKGLIDIGAAGPAGATTLVVRHNEAGHIFHPKMYAFRTDNELRLFAGSNNMTQAGLFQNEELSYRAKRSLPNKLAEELDAFFASMMPPGNGLSRTLDQAFLDALRDKGYVSGEQRLRAKMSAKTAAKRKEPLFGKVGRGAPAVVAPPGAAPPPVPVAPPELPPTTAGPDWQRLTLRLRTSRGGTQGQIPIVVVREMRRRAGQVDIDGVLSLKARDGTEKRISPAGPHAVNTYKVEAMATEGEPILHVYTVGTDLFYELLDSGKGGVGSDLYNQLVAGLATDPPHTFITRPPEDTATWWRYD
jgi:HKD family nuclease